MSAFVRLQKDSRQPEWEVDCVTYSLDWNILNRLSENDLWKMTVQERTYFMSFYVRAADFKNGKLAASHMREGADRQEPPNPNVRSGKPDKTDPKRVKVERAVSRSPLPLE
jgi:aryl-alcohol dehydrogenase-like predicted oxidoreductase